MSLIDRVPARLFVLKPVDRAEFIVQTAALRSFIETWKSHPNTSFTRVSPYQAHVLLGIWRLMRQCPDDVPEHRPKLLAFIGDDDLRRSIETDVAAAHSALGNDEFKAATVMAGAASEALLLWALSDPRCFGKVVSAAAGAKVPAAKTPSDLNNWTLHNYVQVGCAIGLLDADSVTALDLARDFRNLIHPGRSNRLAASCSAGTAHSSIGAMELLIERLRRELP